MGETTLIEWTNHTFNPWIGCTEVSPGCDHCYAETLATSRMGIVWGAGAARRRTGLHNWNEPVRWNRKAAAAGVRERVFCASMADWADAEVSNAWRADLWELIRKTPWLDWQLLTKRANRIRECLPEDWGAGYPNVWLGVSAETQKEADHRIPYLLGVPAAVHFISAEPLLGRVNLSPYLVSGRWYADVVTPPKMSPYDFPIEPPVAKKAASPARVDWVIVGGESGTKARPMHPEWVRILRDQCMCYGVPFFFKQWGEWLPLTEAGIFSKPDILGMPTLKPQYADAVLAAVLRLDFGGFTASAEFFNKQTTKEQFKVMNDYEVTIYRVGKKTAGHMFGDTLYHEFPKDGQHG